MSCSGHHYPSGVFYDIFAFFCIIGGVAAGALMQSGIAFGIGLNDYLKTRIVILSAAKNLVFALLRPFASLRVTVLR